MPRLVIEVVRDCVRHGEEEPVAERKQGGDRSGREKPHQHHRRSIVGRDLLAPEERRISGRREKQYQK